MRNILYIHGMGGGSDSRIPSILQEEFRGTDVNIVVRTYDFDPHIGYEQIGEWVDEIKPSLVIGESLGSLHALRLKGIPHIFVSPALNASVYFEVLAWLTLIPGVTRLFDHIYKPRPGDRQRLHFTFRTLRKYLQHRRNALENSVRNGSEDYFYAFFGTRGNYRKSCVVSIKTWEKYFGKTYSMYNGTHFMEERHVRCKLKKMILKTLESTK